MGGGREDRRDFSFIQISDHHLGESERTLRKGFLPAYAFRAVLRDIAETWEDQVDFIVSTGDLVLEGTAEAYDCVRRMLNLRMTAPPPGPQRVSVEGLQDFPMYFTPGNHDHAHRFSQCLFGQRSEGERLHLSFEHEGVHFVCPDWGPEEAAGAPGPDGLTPLTAPDTTPELAAWLDTAIPDDEPTIVLIHYAPVHLADRWTEGFVPRNLDRFWEVVAGRENVLAVFCGHIHQTFETMVSGIPVFGVASTCYQQVRTCTGRMVRALLPLAYRVIRVTGGTVSTEVCEVDLPLGRRHHL